MDKHFVVGQPVERVDAYDKVTGKATYVGDMKFDHLLQGKILRSPYAHAIVKSIDTSKAKALPGVRAVLTYDDVPHIPFTPCGHPLPFDSPLDSLIFEKEVRYVGDTVAAVAADTKEIAEKAISLIDVEYEELPFLLKDEDILAEGAMEIHKDSKNIIGETFTEYGDVEAGLRDADIVVEDEYRSPIVTHAQIETHISIVDIDNHTGKLTFYVSNQVPTIMRERLAYILGLPRRMVRIVKMTVGGGFGGKQEPVYEFINAVLAQACHCPVMLELTREENLSCTRTRPSHYFKLRTGVTKDGKITTRDLYTIRNNGAYASHGHSVVLNEYGQFEGLYPCPNTRFDGKTIYSNQLIGAAMRAYGMPQYCIANESHIDHIARTLGMDPLDFRLKNLYKQGDKRNFGNYYSDHTCGMPQVLEEGLKRIGYREFRENPPADDGPIKYGIGMALSTYQACVFPFSCEMSGARLMLQDDASATLFINCTEIGQGTDTVMAQIAAETLGVPFEWISVVEGDTDLCPADMGAYASRQTYVTGQAVKKATLKCKEQLLERAGVMLERPAEELDTRMGKVIEKATGKELIDMPKVAENMIYHLTEGGTCGYEAGFIPVENVLEYMGSFAKVAVDTETGKVEVLKLVTCMDCGNLINPQTAMGQLTGGSIMSFGFGMMEQVLIDPKTGRVLNDTLLDYKIPTFADVPDIDAQFIHTYDPAGAYGNKALGEPPNITPAAAIHNAVYDAIGVNIPTNPLTPERVYEAIASAKQGKEA